MKKIKDVLVLTIMLVFCFSFLSYARNGGMSMFKAVDNEMCAYCYYYEDGTVAQNEWKKVWDNWYYFDEDGESKYNTWAEIDGKWYYFNNWSRMLYDTITPDGYKVGSDGAWIESEPQNLENVPTTEAVGPGIN